MGGGEVADPEMTNKTLEYYLALPYTIELTPDEDGYRFAQIPLLKGCMTQGDNREEGIPIPEPTVVPAP